MRAPYLDPSTVEFCERCRCKTWHVLLPRTGERICEWHLEVRVPEFAQAQPERQAEAS